MKKRSFSKEKRLLSVLTPFTIITETGVVLSETGFKWLREMLWNYGLDLKQKSTKEVDDFVQSLEDDKWPVISPNKNVRSSKGQSHSF